MKVYMPLFAATVPDKVYVDLDAAKASFGLELTWERMEDSYFIGVVKGEYDENYIIEEFEVVQ